MDKQTNEPLLLVAQLGLQLVWRHVHAKLCGELVPGQLGDVLVQSVNPGPEPVGEQSKEPAIQSGRPAQVLGRSRGPGGLFSLFVIVVITTAFRVWVFDFTIWSSSICRPYSSVEESRDSGQKAVVVWIVLLFTETNEWKRVLDNR